MEDFILKYSKDRLILVTNDDGVNAKGILALVNEARKFGNVIVVAPEGANSGMSHAITVTVPLRVEKTREEEGLTVYSCSGTPVDCVKIANSVILDRKPDLLLSGINHGSNASTSVFYSGTMGAAIEGTIDGIPSMGFSLTNYDPDADFSSAARYVYKIISDYLDNPGMDNFCLNVNIPSISYELINGIKICRQTMGYWEEEFETRHDPSRKSYYWLTGRYVNQEPGEQDTDQWALKNNYVAIVPIAIDITSRPGMKSLEKWGLEQENLEVQEKFQQNK